MKTAVEAIFVGKSWLGLFEQPVGCG